VNLKSLLGILRQHSGFLSAKETLGNSDFYALTLPLPKSARIALTAAFSYELAVPQLVLVTRNDRHLTFMDELQAWDPDLKLLSFPEPTPLFYDQESWGERTILQRASVLAELRQPETNKERIVIISTARAAMTRTVSPATFQGAAIHVATGDTVDLSHFMEKLIGLGYQASSLVTERGRVSRRGGIVDLWPPDRNLPVRIDFFGDVVDDIREFRSGTQRTENSVLSVTAAPAREGFPAFLGARSIPLITENGLAAPLEYYIPIAENEEYGLIDFIPSNAVVVLDDFELLRDRVTEIEEAALHSRQEKLDGGELDDAQYRPYLGIDATQDTIAARRSVNFGALSTDVVDEESLTQAFSHGRRFGGQVNDVLDFLSARRALHEITIVVSRQAPRLAELWASEGSHKPVLESLPENLNSGEIYFVQGALAEGWTFNPTDAEPINLLTDAEIFGWSRPQPRARIRTRITSPEFRYSDLQTGDFVVHVDHGIGSFDGLVEKSLDETSREFLQVSFADDARVFVPIHQADRLTKYLGSDGIHPKLSRLGAAEWDRAKRKAKEAVEEIAKELLALYAERSQVHGHAFSGDTAWQNELEASFPYLETDDQARALQDAKRDMESHRPMDRLVCGDVGYGKTEVALRLAFKAVMDGKQVALLVPTTVLAQQHHNTFSQRLSPFPVEIEMLSRFRSRAEAQEIIGRMESGEVDIVIGTHRLLQRDVEFKDLGLLIIDEEQRFGVTHKETLKRMRTEVDVLTMTATPIPRTLYMALTGIRDISTINTPPQERVPVTTHVGAYDPQLIRQAILRELERGGQVFFVHNRVHTIEGVHDRVRRLVPEARMAVAHGQMREDTLARVMESFYAGELDVLLSTSIIESGLDVPNANTLIVDRSELFGLSQLYQLRGRVGRGTSRGYSYFFHTSGQKYTDEARERLEIIAEHSDLGAGYSIAMRDLEMRGAGDFLGRRQHGHIAAIGFHYYSRLLAAAIRRLRSKQSAVPQADMSALREHMPVAVDLALKASIPADFVSDQELRLQLYRRMADLQSIEEVQEMSVELRDRFGEIPEDVRNLFYQLTVKVMAHAAGVDSISNENGQLLLQFEVEDLSVNLGELANVARLSKRGIWLNKSSNPDWMQDLTALLQRLT
jgi:transcription-repair coupling factor (superfamily II helicase)